MFCLGTEVQNFAASAQQHILSVFQGLITLSRAQVRRCTRCSGVNRARPWLFCYHICHCLRDTNHSTEVDPMDDFLFEFVSSLHMPYLREEWKGKLLPCEALVLSRALSLYRDLKVTDKWRSTFPTILTNILSIKLIHKIRWEIRKPGKLHYILHPSDRFKIWSSSFGRCSCKLMLQIKKKTLRVSTLGCVF